VTDPSTVVKPGEEITVKVLRIGGDDEKIALGLKQLGDDPWSSVQSRYAIGQVAQGRVTRIADFGAFVELEPGVEALAHASTFVPTGRKGGWAASIAVGTTGPFEVLSIDPEKKRIGVALIDAESSRAASQKAEEAADVRDYATREDAAAGVSGFGSLADKLRGALNRRDD
jgi:small subunit ribosomal protein S1